MPAPLFHDHTLSVFPVFPLLTFIINLDLKPSEAWFLTGNGVRCAQRKSQRAAEEMLQKKTWRAFHFHPGWLFCCSAGWQVKRKYLISPFWLGETLWNTLEYENMKSCSTIWRILFQHYKHVQMSNTKATRLYIPELYICILYNRFGANLEPCCLFLLVF